MINVSDIIESNGKTIKENNLEKNHRFKVGDLIEEIETGVRLFVIRLTRDCDGSPMYNLAAERPEKCLRSEIEGDGRFVTDYVYPNCGVISGIGDYEDTWRLVK